MRRLKEDVAWRMALAWQTPLQERVRLVSSFTSPRLCKSYDWVALNVDKYASLEHQLDQVHTFKAACTVWFALSCCRGYSGKENPGFWKRVFGKLREPRCPSTERERPSSMFHDEYRHPVTDAMRFFDVEEGREFPRVQLFTEAFDGRLRGRESVLIHAFFHGPEFKTTVMDVVDRQLHALLELFAPYIQASRAQRIVPVSIRTSRGSLSESAMVELMPKLPTAIPTIIPPTREPVFVVRDLSYGQSYTEDEGQLETMRVLFRQYAVEISAFNWVTYASNDHLKPAPYLQLLLATDASVRARVLHWFHNLNTSSTKGLAALCSANVQGEFEQSQSAIQHTLRSLPRLDYFYFKLNRTASGKQNEPLSYTEGKMQSSVCLGLSVREISRVVLCDEYLLPFLSVCRHNLMQHSPMRQLDQDVVNLIMAFVACGPQGVCIENEGRDVVWRASNRPFMVY
ncbi:hypothetical protein Poli38472_001437 [Pythium oligandrum]|uniref:Uncharacterized protein n=1 Tax=Pythium oligandrum TaxID=41045 RepID=A0A8K1CVA8_PYTOL|nr:hypothetical protein Poli38472_001437 [Pythium oligandrum]|eukprot:TMW69281.1 hypothetical protein Poli38472_001437 [Pythium oligandrum]